MVQEKTLKILEFPEIRERLRLLTTCECAERMAAELLPLTDRTEIERLLDETEDAVNFMIRRGTPPLAGVADVSGAVRRAAAGGVLSLTELLKISGLLCACRRTRSYCQSVEDTSENRIRTMIAALCGNHALEESVQHTVLSETEISDQASPLLFEIRRKITATQNTIKDRLGELTRSSRYAKALQDGVVTMRGDRYCVPVKVEYRSEIPGIVHDTSSSGQTLFVEPAFVIEANNKIRELRVSEENEINRILMELSGAVAENEAQLLADLTLISYLDFTFAKAKLALDMKAVRPLLSENGEILICAGRNPLIDRHRVVPISLHVGAETGTRAMIITGPNTGGKTVTLKTVGLFTVMMQSGLLIPCAERSVLSVFNGVFADIGDEQSIAQNLSTFSAHMKHITEILNRCDGQSLVLFDELGAGTDPTEGAALAMSILECVYQLGATVFATTHYSELKVFASTTPGFVNASCEFDVDTLRPTYRLLIGVPGKSNAFAISEKLGLDPQIILRAKEFLTGEDLRFEEMLSGIEQKRMQIESDRQESERLHAEARRLSEELRLERESAQAERDALLDKTREKANAILNKARISAETMLTELRKASMNANQESVRSAEEAKRAFESEADQAGDQLSAEYRKTNEKPEPPDALRKGETVRVLSLRCDATVLELPDKEGKVCVQAGIMKVFVPLSDLKRIPEKESNASSGKKKPHSGKGSSVMMKAGSIAQELDVRGMTVDEAIFMLERQINDGILAKQPSFTVIHGKGTGALRKGIHDYLRHQMHVREFRLGTFGEGDAGVTVVTLK